MNQRENKNKRLHSKKNNQRTAKSKNDLHFYNSSAALKSNKEKVIRKNKNKIPSKVASFKHESKRNKLYKRERLLGGLQANKIVEKIKTKKCLPGGLQAKDGGGSGAQLKVKDRRTENGWRDKKLGFKIV